ncbi:SxtJ family membrane protein [Candidatus Pelagibacter sp. HIMB1709]|uniref:SxtJ family membrane protein n=1 Tax=Candidatus Pelagibacter sp. HIMB1709 TaxID=3413367 RepID=UPI003F87B302
MENIKINSNKNFGIVFFIFFLIIAIYPLLNNGGVRYWSLVLSLIFLILGIINSKILTPFNYAWFKFGIFLGKIVSPLIMGVIFFIIVTPIAIIMRVLRKDLLGLKFDNSDSYWIKKNETKSTMKNQF